MAVILSPERDELVPVGALGEGPGEYERARWARPLGPNMLLGAISGTIQEFDPNGRYIKRHPLNWRMSGYITPLLGDTLLFSQPVGTQARFGYPLHAARLSGDTIGSFGTDDRSFDLSPTSAGSGKLIQLLTRESDTSFCALGRWTHRIRLWSVGGELLSDTVARRDYSWPDADKLPRRVLQDEEYPAPWFRTAYRRADGPLLVLVERGRMNRRRGADEEPAREQTLSYSCRQSARIQEIELIDPRTGGLMGIAGGSAAYLMGFTDDSTAWGVVENDDGAHKPQLFRIRFQAP